MVEETKHIERTEQHLGNSQSRIIESSPPIDNSCQWKLLSPAAYEAPHNERRANKPQENNADNDDVANYAKVHLMYEDDGKLYVERKNATS